MASYAEQGRAADPRDRRLLPADLWAPLVAARPGTIRLLDTNVLIPNYYSCDGVRTSSHVSPAEKSRQFRWVHEQLSSRAFVTRGVYQEFLGVGISKLPLPAPPRLRRRALRPSLRRRSLPDRESPPTHDLLPPGEPSWYLPIRAAVRRAAFPGCSDTDLGQLAVATYLSFITEEPVELLTFDGELRATGRHLSRNGLALITDAAMGRGAPPTSYTELAARQQEYSREFWLRAAHFRVSVPDCRQSRA